MTKPLVYKVFKSRSDKEKKERTKDNSSAKLKAFRYGPMSGGMIIKKSTKI